MQSIHVAITRSDGILSEIERADPETASRIAAIRTLTSDPTDENRDAAYDLFDPEE
jgi:hypothetical protein